MARVGDPAGRGHPVQVSMTTARSTLDSCTHDALVMERSQIGARRDSTGSPAPPHKVPEPVGPLDVLPITGSGQAYPGQTEPVDSEPSAT